MDFTDIKSNIDKLKELSEKQSDENDFLKKYSKYIDDVITKLQDNISKDTQTNRSKRKTRGRANGFEKIQNYVKEIYEQTNEYCEKSSPEQIKSKKKTELKINKLCEDIYDIGKSTFNLDLEDVPKDEYHQLRKDRRLSWLARSFERISRNSSNNSLNEPDEEKKLKEEIEKMEKEIENKQKRLEQKKKQLSTLVEERKKKENVEKENMEQYNEPQEEEKKIIEPITLLDGIDDLIKDGECRQSFEFLNNTSLLGNKILGAPKSKAPRMFIILPDPEKCPNSNRPNYWIKYSNWNKSVFNLLLLCECSGGIEENVDNETHLLDTTGYSVRDPYKLLSLFGPFLLYSIDIFMESCGENYPREVVMALGKTKPSDYFLSLSHEIQKVIKEERLVYRNEKKNLDELQQFIEVSRGELETFLKGYDYSNMFCGLDKRSTRDKKIRWVCERHGRKFK